MGNTRIKYNQLKDIPGKKPCRVATISNISNLSSAAPDIVDGVSLSVDDRILVKNQTTSSQNGIYDVVTVGTGSNGVWQRSTDLSTNDDIYEGIDLYVTSGTTNADTIWHLTTPDPITINTTSLTFSQFQSGAAAGIYGGSGTVPTSTVATTTDSISFLGPAVEASGGFNIGTTSNVARLHVLDTSSQFRLSYDSSHHTTVHHDNADLLYFKGIVTAEDSETRFLSNASSSYKIRFGYGNNLANSWNASSINIGGKANFRLTYGNDNPITDPVIDIQTNGITKLGMNSTTGADVGIGISASGGVPGARLDVWENDTTTSNILRLRNGNSSNVFNVRADGSLVINEDALSTADVRVEGSTDQNLLFIDASTDNVGIGTGTPSSKLDVRGGAIFNEDGGNFDFRVEGDTETHLIFADASTNNVAIGNGAPAGRLHVTVDSEGDSALVIDGLNSGTIFGVRNSITKQADAQTTGTNTVIVTTIPLGSDQRVVCNGRFIAREVSGTVSVGGDFMFVAEMISNTVTIVGSDVSIKHNSGGTPSVAFDGLNVNPYPVRFRATGGGENLSWLFTYTYEIIDDPAA